MKAEHENQKSKLSLKKVSNPNDEQSLHSLNEIREVGSYTWIAESITEEQGFPSCIKDTDACLFCEGQLFVMRHGAEETNQSTDSFGQVLTIINHQTGNTNIFTRSLHPLQDNGDWTPWQMVATGDPELIAENNSINETLSAMRQQIEDNSKRIDAAKTSISNGTTARFDRIEENEATINAGKIGSIPSAIVYYKPANKFVAADSSDNYYDTWDGMEAYMCGGTIRKDKLYLYDGELYTSTTENNLSSLNEELLIRGAIQNEFKEIAINVQKGSYISKDGKIYSNNAAYYSTPLAVSKNDIIIFKGRGGSSNGLAQVATISLTDADASYYVPVVIRGEQAEYSAYYVEADGFLAFSWIITTHMKDNGYAVFKSNSELLKQLREYTDGELSKYSEQASKEFSNISVTLNAVQQGLDFKKESVSLELISGYIYKTGAVAEHRAYSYSKPIFVKKGDIVTTISAGTADASVLLAISTSKTPSKYTVIQTHTKTNELEEATYRTEEDCYVCVSGNTSYGLGMYVSSISVPIDAETVNSNFDKWVYSFINKCICIGDSVTEGHVYDYPRTKANGDVLKEQSYPARLAKLTGWNIENAGFSGISAINWWKNKLNNYQYADYEIAIIELGYNGGLTDTLDVDVEPYETYAEYAETNTGCYCKIIESITETNPNIFIVLCISSRMTEESTNSIVIKKIAERYALPYIDLSDKSFLNLDNDKFHGYTDENMSLNMVHFNALGYCAKAGFINNWLPRILINHGKELNDKHIL